MLIATSGNKNRLRLLCKKKPQISPAQPRKPKRAF